MSERPIGCRCMALDDPAWHSQQCWIRQTDALRQELAEMTQERQCDANRLHDASEHWHTLYRDCAVEKADAAARYGQQIVYLERQLAEAQNAKVKS